MPDRPLTIATYAAGASLAAITLVYVFGPTFFLDDEQSASNRKKGVVGLLNPANDCFINSILQALAGLPDLRHYLIRETHRRRLDGPEVYKLDPDDGPFEDENKRPIKAWKLEGLQQGLVTQALKEVLDKLNERPIYKKVISAQAFVAVLEHAFRTRISRQQQDAQEFLQIVTERLEEEYHAGRKARRRRGGLRIEVPSIREEEKDQIRNEASIRLVQDQEQQGQESEKAEKDGEQGDEKEDTDPDEGFPFEGKIESQIECMTCKFKPKPSESTFVTLTLHVPQKSSTTLNACFDIMLKVEHIDDFKCDYCRLVHAIQVKEAALSNASSEETKLKLQEDISKIQRALEDDPEKPPENVELPDKKLAPSRRIARHMRISEFPKVLALHLSRSMYSAATLQQKNLAKVQFPESLPLGGILDQHKYRLLCTVTHKGGHNSGHYESFRRQTSQMPYSTPHSFGATGAYSRQNSPNPSAVQSPKLSTTNLTDETGSEHPSPHPSSSEPLTLASPGLVSPAGSLSSRSSLSSRQQHQRPPTSTPREDSLAPPTDPMSPSTSSQTSKAKSIISKAPSIAEVTRYKKPKRSRDHRWWRISDEKIKECRTSDVLGMQKEVYLLFYELDRSEAEE
jgi:ubiquitin carboxyl-terminal hydrolase 16